MPRYSPAARPVIDDPNMMPLDYMLQVIRDVTASKARRDRMAALAAPYCHARVIEAAARPPGKKDQQAEAAQIAGLGTPWAVDLEFDNPPN